MSTATTARRVYNQEAPHYYIADIGGDCSSLIEVSILEVEIGEIKAVFHQYGIPPDMARAMDQGNLNKFRFREAPYSHGIHPKQLARLAEMESNQLIVSAINFISKDILVVSNDRDTNSDIARLLKHNNCKNRYKNIYLGDWVARDSNISHKLARDSKIKSEPILGVACNYASLHSIPLSFRKMTPSVIKKIRHGAHCSLYDCLEVYEAVKNGEVSLLNDERVVQPPSRPACPCSKYRIPHSSPLMKCLVRRCELQNGSLHNQLSRFDDYKKIT